MVIRYANLGLAARPAMTGMLLLSAIGCASGCSADSKPRDQDDSPVADEADADTDACAGGSDGSACGSDHDGQVGDGGGPDEPDDGIRLSAGGLSTLAVRHAQGSIAVYDDGFEVLSSMCTSANRICVTGGLVP